MKINRSQLLKEYLNKINSISDDLDWKTHFGPEEIVGIICNILEENSDLIDVYPENDVN